MSFRPPAASPSCPRSAPSRPLCWLLAALLVMLLAPPLAVFAYEDLTYNYTVQAPSTWLPLARSVVPTVPGFYRFGWVSPRSLENQAGASIVTFVQVTDSAFKAAEMLQKNVEVANREKLKVVKQQLIQVGKFSGYVLEVVGPGTGLAIVSPRSATGKKLKFVPTRQRWYALCRDRQVVVLLSTCQEKRFAAFAPIFSGVERTLQLH